MRPWPIALKAEGVIPVGILLEIHLQAQPIFLLNGAVLMVLAGVPACLHILRWDGALARNDGGRCGHQVCAIHYLRAMRLATFMLGAHLVLMNISGGGLLEFARFGALVDHLCQHRAVRPELGVIELLAMHYLSPEHDSSDRAKHAQLPFHYHAPPVTFMAEPVNAQGGGLVLPMVGSFHPPDRIAHIPRVTARSIDHPPQG